MLAAGVLALTPAMTDIQPQSDEDDDVEESATLLPRQALQSPENPLADKPWWRIPVTWEVMV